MALNQIKTIFSVLVLIITVLSFTIIKDSNASLRNSELTDKKILSLLFENLDIKLSSAQFCKNVGTDISDKKLSDYLAGFWSYHTSNKKGKNWVEISSESISAKVQLAKVMIYRKDGEENWGWGVSFEIDKLNLTVNRKSFTCLGSG